MCSVSKAETFSLVYVVGFTYADHHINDMHHPTVDKMLWFKCLSIWQNNQFTNIDALAIITISTF